MQILRDHFEQTLYIKEITKPEYEIKEVKEQGEFTWNVSSCQRSQVGVDSTSNFIDLKSKANEALPLSVRLGLRSRSSLYRQYA